MASAAIDVLSSSSSTAFALCTGGTSMLVAADVVTMSAVNRRPLYHELSGVGKY